MAHYIELTDIIKTIDDLVYATPFTFYNGLLKARNAIAALPTVDIVKCKDCKWFNEMGCAISIVDDSDKPTEHDFCSFGERR